MTSSPNGWFPAGDEDEKNANNFWAHKGHPELLICSNFSKTSRNIHLKDDYILVAECCNIRGEFVTSTLDLNRVLGNDNGKFATGGGFLETCKRPVELNHEGRALHARISDGSMHNRVSASLDTFIGNDNGKLVCAYWDEDRCQVCNGFPRPGAKVVQGLELKGPRRLANCPSCTVLESILHTLEPKGFRHRNTQIRCIKRGASGLPEMIFECTGGNSGPMKEHFAMYRLSGEVTKTYQFQKCFLPESHHLSSGSASEKCLSIVRGWIDECEQKHDRCAHEQKLRSYGTTGGTLPSRVLDIGNTETDTIRLIETKDGSARYICLSHCWGKSQTLTLTKANLRSLQNEIPMNDLQSVYCDAISFCRRLGVSYIWIDALCIIQDDPDDWATEAAKMASYYGQCYVCLAATSAADHDGGCSTLTPRWKFDGKGVDGLPYAVYVRPNPFHIADGDHAEHFPLLTRAWVYQERRLSPRVLHFCGSEVFFECASMGVCECRRTPKPMQSLSWTKNRETYVGGHHLLSDTENIKDERDDIKQEWHAFVTGYTTLALTHAKDRLPALAGLAKLTRKRREAARIPTGHYLAGLWEEQLASDMAWSVGKSVSCYQKESNKSLFRAFEQSRKTASASHPRPEGYIAPSWSWASVLDVVNFAPFEYTQTLCTILQAETEPMGKDDYGQVKSGTLVIQARLLQSTYASNNNEHRLDDVPGTKNHTFLNGLNKGMAFWPDYDVGAEGRGKLDKAELLYLMPLVSRVVLGRGADAEFRFKLYPGHTKVETVYLVLRRVVSGNVPVFERVGWTEYTGSSKIPDMKAAKEMKFMLV